MVNVFVVPAEKPLYCPDAGSFTVSEGEETSTSVLTVQDVPVVVTVTVTLVPVVARETEVDVSTLCRHCDCAKTGAARVMIISTKAAAKAIFLSSIFLFIIFHFP